MHCHDYCLVWITFIHTLLSICLDAHARVLKTSGGSVNRTFYFLWWILDSKLPLFWVIHFLMNTCQMYSNIFRTTAVFFFHFHCTLSLYCLIPDPLPSSLFCHQPNLVPFSLRILKWFSFASIIKTKFLILGTVGSPAIFPIISLWVQNYKFIYL